MGVCNWSVCYGQDRRAHCEESRSASEVEYTTSEVPYPAIASGARNRRIRAKPSLRARGVTQTRAVQCCKLPPNFGLRQRTKASVSKQQFAERRQTRTIDRTAANGDVWPLAPVVDRVAVTGAPTNTAADTPAVVCWASVIVNVAVVPAATTRPRYVRP